jgi:dCTP deaminase
MLKPTSYVCRLGERVIRWRKGKKLRRPWQPSIGLRSAMVEGKAKELRLRPMELLLGCTIERFRLPEDLVGIISTLSHMSRFGVSATFGSMLISPGFGSQSPTALSLELFSVNPSPLVLPHGVPIVHVAFAKMEGAANTALQLGQSVYDGRPAPTPPLLYEEFSQLVRVGGRRHPPA